MLAIQLQVGTMVPEPPGGHRRPPQEAYDACVYKAEGDVVEISTPRGTPKATCRSIDGELVAVPVGTSSPPDGGPDRWKRS